jgi:cardiolipin synthase A/B
MVDDAGSWFLPSNFFKPLTDAGAEVRRFNPLNHWRFGVRNHRKLMVCDDSVAFIGGFNVADEYDGDGVVQGWFDLGICIQNTALSKELASSFDELFSLTDFHLKPLCHLKPLLRLRLYKRKLKFNAKIASELLTIQPGRGASHFQKTLYRDLTRAHHVRIVSAYFLPTRRLCRDLIHLARQGIRVQLLLAGKSDVEISQMAARSLYYRLLKAGIEIYEYQPQILHAKLIVIDGITYVGSSNFDIRSLNLNYELMVRFEDKSITATAQEIFSRALDNSKQIELHQWRKNHTFWNDCKNHWMHFLLTRIDPFISLKHLALMKN